MTWRTCSLLQRRRMASTGGRGSTSCSIFTQLRRIIAASVVEVAMTMPGQSRSLMCLSKCTSWRHLKFIKPFRRTAGKQDFTGMQDRQFTVNLLGDARSGSNATRSCPFQTVDQTTLSHVRKTYKTGVRLVWNCFTLGKIAKQTVKHRNNLVYYWMWCLPTTPTVMAVFMSRLRQ